MFAKGVSAGFKVAIVALALCLSGCLEVGIGPAYVANIPKTHLTGHEQFHISVGNRTQLTENIVLQTEWNHFSNGAQLGIGRYPNYGLDFFSTRVIYIIK